MLRQLFRVLHPGGTIGFAFSRGTDPRWTWDEQLLGDVGAPRRLLARGDMQQPSAIADLVHLVYVTARRTV